MSLFIRVLHENAKASAVLSACANIRSGTGDARIYCVQAVSFKDVPGSPFCYWSSNQVRSLFSGYQKLERAGQTCRMGMATANDFRFVRCWWELHTSIANSWFPMAKGGEFSLFYSDLRLVVKWTKTEPQGNEIKAFAETTPGTTHWSRNIRNIDYYFKAGLTWPLRTHRFCPQILPAGSIISVRGSGIYSDSPIGLLGILASSAVDYLMKLVSGRDAHPQFDGGDISLLPLPNFQPLVADHLAVLASRAWALKRTLDTIEENSHAFLLPATLRAHMGDYDPPAIEAELARIQAEIDDIAFDLYDFSPADRAAALGAGQTVAIESDEDAPGGEEDEADEAAAPVDDQDALRSWAIGVAFGRFDWRLATGEREAPPEPEPFDPLPAKSPGMLPDGAAPFHAHPGILADDPGHPHDLTRLTERVLERVGQPVPPDLRRWLQREFFPFHLQRYSKSRRKAPLYWPLATPSGSYTLWLYYPDLSSQTLYTAVNDFLDGPTGKLAQVTAELTRLRAAGSARSRDDERRLETLTTLDTELRDLRDTLLQIAPTYQPNHDDGVQITAAPLWPLFRHKPWQKLLKETWTKLEKGDYDWAHLAMAYWPQRVREKCKTDKSLAIAHGLEDLYIEPEAAPKKTRGRKKTST